LIGRPISRSLATSCVCLELRLLPSTGITRLQRYYGPLRHPRAPGLSLTGVRLIIPDHAKGLPVLRALSMCTCCHHYPGAAAGHGLRSDAQPYQPSPERRPGRPAHCPFRGLHGVHLRCGLYTRAGHLNATRYPKASAISLPCMGLFLSRSQFSSSLFFCLFFQHRQRAFFRPSIPPRGRYGHPA